MKASRDYTKEYYREQFTNVEFNTIEAAAEYLAEKYGASKEKMKTAIANDTNCDAVYFEDGSVILYEF